MTAKTFTPDECEVSDDQINWKPMVGNTGRYGRVRPEVWRRFCIANLGSDPEPTVSTISMMLPPNKG